ncbi:unnamed protein product, partial [Iphiclides podalirius]
MAMEIKVDCQEAFAGILVFTRTSPVYHFGAVRVRYLLSFPVYFYLFRKFNAAQRPRRNEGDCGALASNGGRVVTTKIRITFGTLMRLRCRPINRIKVRTLHVTVNRQAMRPK